MHGKAYRKWKKLLAEFWTSGLTLAEYCRRHNLNSKSAGRWKNVFQKEGIEQIILPDKLDIVQLNFEEPLWQQHPSGVRLELGELRIELAKNFDRETLERVLSLLEVR